MKRLLNYKVLFNVFTAITFSCLITFGNFIPLVYILGDEGKFDFEYHETEFISGDFKSNTFYDIEHGQTFYSLEFKDGCIVGFVSDNQGRKIQPFYWINKIRHGKLV